MTLERDLQPLTPLDRQRGVTANYQTQVKDAAKAAASSLQEGFSATKERIQLARENRFSEPVDREALRQSYEQLKAAQSGERVAAFKDLAAEVVDIVARKPMLRAELSSASDPSAKRACDEQFPLIVRVQP